MDNKITYMIEFLTYASNVLQSTLEECKPDSNDLQDNLEYDRKIAQMKEIKSLIKKLKNER